MSAPSPSLQRTRRRLLVGSTVALALGVLAALWFGVPGRIVKMPAPVQPGVAPSTPAIVEPSSGRPAPDFALPLFTGGTLTLRSLRGKPIVLNFWASWCVPCREETPLLVRLHTLYGPRIVFVGVNVEDEDADARRFLAQYHVDYPAVWSSDEKMIVAYKIVGLPTTVFVGTDGIIMERYAGGFVGPEGEKTLRLRLDRLLRRGVP